ncbi:hypothetical protein NX02_06620 [Sphingomonas sanxanigenens DSM 19645 = NX02]|uniref:Uncharacterized protein n=2 Tax=Sphingomonas sanxanigenens TaxID=397260 RepID=W0A538_9SPHN|nr:hypothetical protein NX02_06620 [Sphingomonas sanxanigenens DSM 19645 = NX02]
MMRGVDAARIRIAERLPGPYVAAAFDGIESAEARRVDVRVVLAGGCGRARLR